MKWASRSTIGETLLFAKVVSGATPRDTASRSVWDALQYPLLSTPKDPEVSCWLYNWHLQRYAPAHHKSRFEELLSQASLPAQSVRAWGSLGPPIRLGSRSTSGYLDHVQRPGHLARAYLRSLRLGFA